MSLNVTGSASVYKVVDKGNFVTATLRTAKKDKDGEWQSEFFNCKFVGKEKDSAKKLADKDKITLVSAILESRKVEEKTYQSIVIFEFTSGAVETYKEPIADDTDDSELPF